MMMTTATGRRRVRARASATLIAIGALVITGCSPSGEQGPTEGGADDTPDTFVMATSSSGLAPDFSNYSAQQLFAAFQAVYDFPMHFNTETGELEPWMATDWTYDESRTELTLTVRDDMKFSDGSPVTASDLKANFDQRITLADAGFNYENIRSIEAPSEAEVVITLKDSDYFFLNAVATTHIAHPSALTEKENPFGSGPYVLDQEQTVPGKTYVFMRNEHYWNPEPFAYDTVEVEVMADVTARVNALVSGQVDYAPIDGNAAESAESRGFEVLRNNATSTILLPFDRTGDLVPALGNVQVRQALQHAIDRETIANTIDHGDGGPSDQYFVEGQPWYLESGTGKYDYDPEKARRLLADAGYPDGFVIGDVPSLWFPEYEPAVKQYLADVGVEINFVTAPLEEEVPKLLAGEVPAAVWNDGVWNPPNEILPTGVWNPRKYSTPEYDALLDKVNSAAEEDLAEANVELSRYIYDNAWFIQIAHPASYFAASDEVDVELAGLQAFAGFDGIYLWDVKPAE